MVRDERVELLRWKRMVTPRAMVATVKVIPFAVARASAHRQTAPGLQRAGPSSIRREVRPTVAPRVEHEEPAGSPETD